MGLRRCVAAVLLVVACDDGGGGGSAAGSNDAGGAGQGGGAAGGRPEGGAGAAGGACAEGDSAPGLDPTLYLPGGLVAPITEQPCVLSNGETVTCHRIELRGVPTDHEVGAFCPRTIRDGADAGGLWIDSGEVYDVDGSFIVGLAERYDDETWQLHDPDTGEVFVTEGPEACRLAARPNVDPAYQNHCVECLMSDVGGGVPATILIPKTPVRAARPLEIGAVLRGQEIVGVALNGLRLDPPAPIPFILAAHTIAPFDDCGAHINPDSGYHYHADVGCPTRVAQCDGHAPLIGYAVDGYPIHAMRNADGSEPDDLDECRGHTDGARGYHYHVASAGENAFVGCFRGEIFYSAPRCHLTPEGAPCCGDGQCRGPERTETCPEDCPP